MEKKNKNHFMDGEKLFIKWCEMGGYSVARLCNFAISEGMKNTVGRNPTRMGAWKAMWRWASMKENKDRAFELFSKIYTNKVIQEDPWIGQFFPDGLTETAWKTFMLEKIQSAWQHTSEIKEYRFLEKNGWI